MDCQAPAMLRREPHRLVFLDETSVKNNLACPRGRTPVGEWLYGATAFGKFWVQTFIASLTSDALIAP